MPPGFPESYLPTFQKLLKNFLKGRKLDEELKRTVNVINKIPIHHKMEELFLDNHYNSIIAKTQGQGTVEYMDNLFCETLQDKTNQLFASEADIYINSCYRLHKVIDNYQSFSPKKKSRLKFNKPQVNLLIQLGYILDVPIMKLQNSLVPWKNSEMSSTRKLIVIQILLSLFLQMTKTPNKV